MQYNGGEWDQKEHGGAVKSEGNRITWNKIRKTQISQSRIRDLQTGTDRRAGESASAV